MTCASCIHWTPVVPSMGVDDKDQPFFGRCRLLPPVVIPPMVIKALNKPTIGEAPLYEPAEVNAAVWEGSVWPITTRQDECGKCEGGFQL